MAVAHARAPIVAIVEEHVVVLEGWAEALVKAHDGPWAAVCGELHCADLTDPLARRIEMFGLGPWSTPARRGESEELRWRNVSYKRTSLMRYGEKLPLYLGSESILFRKLRQDGERLWVEPDAKFVHAHGHTWPAFLVETFHATRLNADREAKLLELTWVGRLLCAARKIAGAVRWPWVIWRRTQLRPQAEGWTKTFYGNFFFVLEYCAVSAMGGVVGALAGEGDSERQFLSFEINERPWITNAPPRQ